jgi:hypothetical protein
MFILAVVFILAWVMAMGGTGTMAALQALVAFIGAGVMLGLGFVLWKLDDLVKQATPSQEAPMK